MAFAINKDGQARIKGIQQQLRESGVEALWVTSFANRRYLSNFSGSAGWLLIPRHGQGVLITDGRYQTQAAKECKQLSVFIYQKEPYSVLKSYIYKWKAKSIGFEDEQVSVKGLKQLQKQIPGVKTRAASGWIEQARAIKSAGEIKLLQQAVAIAQKAFNQILPKIKPGMKEIEIKMLLENGMFQGGGEGLAFPTIVASGPNSAMPHAQPGKRCLKAGDLVVLDFGCTFQGYHSDLTRTIAVAKMSAKQKDVYKIVKKAQNIAQKELISGRFAAEADKASRMVFKAQKLEKHFMHSLGHGLGLEVHEGPKLSFRSQERLAAGMVVTCEPGLYFPGWGGIRIEDDVLVTEKGPRWLSESPEQLMVTGKSKK